MEQQKLIEIIAKSLNIPSGEIAATTSLSHEIGVDSIEMVTLCRNLTKTFNCNLNVAEIKEADTVEKLFMYIEEKQKVS
ncbi:MAG TPA: acyl carrier protein [Methylomusa anaerophila]|uniref:Acyl carrier protein n=1 Tax=Methylomusa anaerophila TaxID=1930071 RepID=A0A348AIP8_9FIRM|nr:acyl carrier protein [Methylomusa anaerophila]BBB90946.1 acyl carrier protein [Methylomusa anaerophila]HML90427.1 acyl carrier protein [Methylomusa anaerophila]